MIKFTKFTSLVRAAIFAGVSLAASSVGQESTAIIYAILTGLELLDASRPRNQF
jgi:hypothetical protein